MSDDNKPQESKQVTLSGHLAKLAAQWKENNTGSLPLALNEKGDVVWVTRKMRKHTASQLRRATKDWKRAEDGVRRRLPGINVPKPEGENGNE